MAGKRISSVWDILNEFSVGIIEFVILGYMQIELAMWVWNFWDCLAPHGFKPTALSYLHPICMPRLVFSTYRSLSPKHWLLFSNDWRSLELRTLNHCVRFMLKLRDINEDHKPSVMLHYIIFPYIFSLLCFIPVVDIDCICLF